MEYEVYTVIFSQNLGAHFDQDLVFDFCFFFSSGYLTRGRCSHTFSLLHYVIPSPLHFMGALNVYCTLV